MVKKIVLFALLGFMVLLGGCPAAEYIELSVMNDSIYDLVIQFYGKFGQEEYQTREMEIEYGEKKLLEGRGKYPAACCG